MGSELALAGAVIMVGATIYILVRAQYLEWKDYEDIKRGWSSRRKR